MPLSNRRETLILLCGDLVCFFLALVFSLYIRGLEKPDLPSLAYHLYPFSILFTLALLVFFIAGLYEKHTLFFQSRLPSLLLNAQLINAVIALVFFYFIPIFGINPKTILFLYLVTAFVLIFLWRLYGRKIFQSKKRHRALLLARGEEMKELILEVNNNPRYPFLFSRVIDIDTENAASFESIIRTEIEKNDVSLVVSDMRNVILSPELSELQIQTAKKIYWVDFSDVYELVFDRVSLENFNPGIFIEQSRSNAHVFYDLLKRVMDLFLGSILSLVGLVLYPFVYIFVKLDDGGEVFIPQVRIGESEEPLAVYKFRTMRTNNARSEKWIPEEKNMITRVGHILRKMSLDEVPQVFNVFRGTMSLIGPRADIEGLGKRLKAEIPNYTLRTLIKPGISGWAQIQQIYKKGNISPQSIEETRLRLSYDLFYIKYRSVFLDIKIALRTITILLSRIFS